MLRVWSLRQTRGSSFAGDPAFAQTLRLVFTALAVAAVFGVVAIRRLRLQASTYQRQVSLCIVGWAVAEMVAVCGALLLFLIGSSLVFAIGLLAMGVALLLLPVPIPA